MYKSTTMNQINCSVKNGGLGLKNPNLYIYPSQITILQYNLDDALKLFKSYNDGKSIYDFYGNNKDNTQCYYHKINVIKIKLKWILILIIL